MSQYVGCEQARTLLDGLIDGELSMADQLAVESHLRWCNTCALRVEDMRAIGTSLRMQAMSRPADPADATLTVISEGVLVRVRAERDQSIPFRLREMFADMRLLWPAMGATAAVLLCVAAAVSVLRASTVTAPDSLAAVISVLGSAPGTEKNPVRPADNGISIPKSIQDEAMIRTSGTLELLPEDDVIYTVHTVVGRDGSLSTFMPLDDRAPAYVRNAREQAVMNAARSTKFVPAHTSIGDPVAVEMVWMIAKVTAVAPPPPVRRSAVEPRPKDGPKPAPSEPDGPPLSGSQGARRGSATA